MQVFCFPFTSCLLGPDIFLNVPYGRSNPRKRDKWSITPMIGMFYSTKLVGKTTCEE
jgi:hypothetical protein